MELRLKVKKLGKVYKAYGGRNNSGRITLRHRGSGNKNVRYLLNNKYKLEGLVGRIVHIQRDNKRTGYIGLVRLSNDYLTYVLLANNNMVGDYIMCAINKYIFKGVSFLGSIFKLKYLNEGDILYNLENEPNYGGTIGRSGGVKLKLIKQYTQQKRSLVKMASGKYKMFNFESRVSLGAVSNMENRDRKLYKAGQNRWLGYKAKVRGEAMNPVDHPHGGRTKGGRVPVSAWGKLTKGVKTRDKHKKL